MVHAGVVGDVDGCSGGGAGIGGGGIDAGGSDAPVDGVEAGGVDVGGWVDSGSCRSRKHEGPLHGVECLHHEGHGPRR